MPKASSVLRFVVCVPLPALLVFSLLVSTAQAAFPGTNGKIAFARCSFDELEPDLYTDCDIWTMNPDGSNEQNLNAGENPVALDYNPSWSADGTKIAFVSERNAPTGADIYLMNADGSNETPLALADKSDNQGSPAWSPDGTKLAFATADFVDPDIHIANVDGSDRRVLTATAWDDATPNWSPDGTKIAFRSLRVGYWAIFTIDADDEDDSSVFKVTDNDGPYDQEPNWSPDGSKLVFQNDAGGPYDLLTINPDGSNQQNLIHPPGVSNPPNDPFNPPTPNGAIDNQAAWSPDGTAIVFGSNRAADGGSAKVDFDIWKFNANGSTPTRLTTDPASDIDPDMQRIPYAYPRPVGASPVRVSLVPAFNQCLNITGPQHNAPLAYPSCMPPSIGSTNLTVGTPDLNGQSAAASGLVEVKVINALLATQDDQYTVNMTDVRCAGTTGGCSGGALTDYSGDLQATTTIRVTDKNSWPLNTAATMIDIPFSFGVPCTSTGASGLPNAVGSTCSVVTTANTIVPGFVTFGKRQVVELGQIRLFDGGSDGIASTTGNLPFAVQGVFNP
jgi:Tol biopolymer transport system component